MTDLGQRPDLGNGPVHRPELVEIADELIAREGRGHTPFGLYVLGSHESAAELARSVERDVFLEYFGNSPELLAHEYERFEQSSFFLCVVDHGRRVPAGVIRIIVNSPAGLKSLQDLEHGWDVSVDDLCERSGIEMDLDDVWDVATLAVTSEYRGAATNGLISAALYQGVGGVFSAHRVRWMIAILDLVALDLVQGAVHRPFQRFDGVEPRRYLDSPSSLPVWADWDEYLPRLKMIAPDDYELFVEGRGMEDVISLPSGRATGSAQVTSLIMRSLGSPASPSDRITPASSSAGTGLA